MGFDGVVTTLLVREHTFERKYASFVGTQGSFDGMQGSFGSLMTENTLENLMVRNHTI